MRTLLNNVSLTVMVAAAFVLVVGAVLGGVWLVRRFIPATREGYHAEISAAVLGVVAAIFGLLLAFVIVIAYENYLDADTNVSREADALASIVRDSAAFPEPGGAAVRRSVGAYVRSVVNDEWPAMRDGSDTDSARAGLNGVFAAFRTVEPRTASQRAFYDDAVRKLNDALEARRDRIEFARGGVPRDIVLLLIFCSLVIVGYAMAAGSPSYAFHVLGPLAIGLVVAASLLVLADLSYPFSGDVAVRPDAFSEGILGQFL